MRATAAQIHELLGDVPPHAIARLLATGASIEEVAAAASAVEDEDAFGEQPHEANARMRDVRAIIEEYVLERIDAADDDREVARV